MSSAAGQRRVALTILSPISTTTAIKTSAAHRMRVAFKRFEELSDQNRKACPPLGLECSQFSSLEDRLYGGAGRWLESGRMLGESGTEQSRVFAHPPILAPAQGRQSAVER